MRATVKQICEFYKTYPEYIGKIKTLTPFGMKTIQYADITAYGSEIISISTNNTKLEGSPSHRIKVNGEWMPFKDLKINDLVHTINGCENINEISKLDYREDLYDFQIEDVCQYYTNGVLSHNSSFLEAIPFALFGQINKGVALPKIINWRNGKQCEVKLYFRKDGVSYIIHRGIKPGILTLFKDGIEVPKLSDKRLFQAELENDLIGMDFKAAQALLFQNANNMVSLFNTPKADKRRFIERFFNLEIYSKANEVTNKKLKGVDDKLTEINVDRSYKQKSIDDLTKKIESFIPPDLSFYEGNLVTLQVRYGTFIDQNPDLDEHLVFLDNLCTELTKQRDELGDKVTEVKDKLAEIRLEIRSMKTEKDTLNKRLTSIGDLTEQKDKLNKVKVALTKMEDAEEQLEKYTTETSTLKQEIRDILGDKKSLEVEHKRVLKDISEWTGKESAGEGTCPTCYQEVDIEHIREHIQSKVTELDVIRQNVEEQLINLGVRHTGVEEKLHDVDRHLQVWTSTVTKKRQLEQAFAKLQGVEEKEVEQNEIMLRIVSIDCSVSSFGDIEEDLVKQVEVTEQEYKDAVLRVNNNNTLINKCKDFIREKEKLSNELDTAQSILDNQKEIHGRLVGEHEANIVTKAQLESEIVSTQTEAKKLEMMKDYLEHIKFTLKDENVKQYAISSIIPYLQQQTNHYLAETGNYYLELDNWLDGTIKGFGVGDCDFGNMSGGEGRSIDLALKFAMMDVARRQAGSYLDILVLDELLDSSIDSFGLEKTMEIVKLKQREDDLKVFIVSHREEVGAFGADNVYQVTKENGMSNIEKVDG